MMRLDIFQNLLRICHCYGHSLSTCCHPRGNGDPEIIPFWSGSPPSRGRQSLIGLLALSLMSITPTLHAKPSALAKLWPGNWFSKKQPSLHERMTQLENDQIDNPTDPYINYNLGVARYKEGQYTEAIKNFAQSLLHVGDDLALKKRGYFNQAKNFYSYAQSLLGPDWEQSNLEEQKLNQALESTQNACTSFKAFLELDPGSMRGKKALAESEELLRKLLKKLPEQNKDKNPKEKNQGKQPQDKKSQDQGEQNQDTQSQDQQTKNTQDKQPHDKQPDDTQDGEKKPQDQPEKQPGDDNKQPNNQPDKPDTTEQKSPSSNQNKQPVEQNKFSDDHAKQQLEALLKALEDQEGEKHKNLTKQAMQGGNRARNQKPW